MSHLFPTIMDGPSCASSYKKRKNVWFARFAAKTICITYCQPESNIIYRYHKRMSPKPLRRVGQRASGLKRAATAERRGDSAAPFGRKIQSVEFPFDWCATSGRHMKMGFICMTSTSTAMARFCTIARAASHKARRVAISGALSRSSMSSANRSKARFPRSF